MIICGDFLTLARLQLSLALLLPTSLGAQTTLSTCREAGPTPPKFAQLRSAVLSPNNAAEFSVDGGQAIIVELQNGDLLGTQVELNLRAIGHPGCRVRVMIPAQATVRYAVDLFADVPIRWVVGAEIINVESGRVNVRVLGERQSNLSGNWTLRFRLEQNTEKPQEQPHPWLNFSTAIVQTGAKLRGTLVAPEVRGEFSCTIQGLRCVSGRMKLAWDAHDWQQFSFGLNNTQTAGRGNATIRFSNGHLHRYSFTITRNSQ